ncbi:MAG: L,D-transpeptidase [Bauldia sp.]|nr:L,D-transpeptidase [Bauldia sp.]
MRKTILLAAGVVVGIAAGATVANAAVKSYWDEQARKWVKYEVDTTGRLVGSTASETRSFNPIVKQIIAYDGPFRPNTIVINTAERRLYYVFAPGKAWKYGVGVGREGFQWSGADWISAKAEWPGWTPPPEMIRREKAKGRILPAHMPGGPSNPLGARALYIGGSMYRIHGSNEPWSIGRAVSSGCIRLTNDDVVDLYAKIKVGTRVVVLSGNESPARIAALAVPPAPKKPKPEIVEARAKDDAVTTDITGSVTPETADEEAPAANELVADATDTMPEVAAADASTSDADPVRRRVGH